MKNVSILHVATVSMVLVGFGLALQFLIASALTSADVRASIAAQNPVLNVSNFEPGDVKFVILNSQRILIWRRNAEDMALAAQQDDPSQWRESYSRILGEKEPVYASDANLTLNSEWFVASPWESNTSAYIYFILRAGSHDGLFEGRYAVHYDLAGRALRGHGRNLTIVKSSLSNDGKNIRFMLGH